MGYRSLWRRLRDSYKLHVKQTTVLKLLRLIDPHGVNNRKRRKLHQRNYSVPGPNHVWHSDGYDKLKPYGFAVRTCIDGFSRKVLWLKLGTSNNKPQVIAFYYCKLVLKMGFIPRVLRVDAGTENTFAGMIQRALRHHDDDQYAVKGGSFVVGPSTGNQRIERYWGEARHNIMGFYIDLFKTMIDSNILNNKDIVDREVLRFCFAHLIQSELSTGQEEWNSHRLRAQSSEGIPSGIPNILFHQPSKFWAEDCKRIINKDGVHTIKERYTIQPQLYSSWTKDMIKCLVPQVTTPNNPQDAYNLFCLIKERMSAQSKVDVESALLWYIIILYIEIITFLVILTGVIGNLLHGDYINLQKSLLILEARWKFL